MQVRAGRAATRPYHPDPLPSNDQVALFDEKRGIVRVTAYQAIAMVDFDQFTIGRMHLCDDDLTACRREHRGAAVRRKVDTFMKALLTGEGIDSPAEIR